jgi:hypothetical protein
MQGTWPSLYDMLADPGFQGEWRESPSPLVPEAHSFQQDSLDFLLFRG